MNQRLLRVNSTESDVWRRKLKIPRLACWGFAAGCVWLAVESLGADAGVGVAIASIALLAAVVAVLESGRDLDSASLAFRTFWLLLGAVIVPILLAVVLSILNNLIDPGSDAPITVFMLWLTLHIPFYVFMPPATGSLIPWLTAVQWAIIAGFTAWSTRDWRIYEAVAIAVATILATGVAIVISLLLMGYRFQFAS